MDELVEEKLRAMGISPDAELASILNEWKRRQDAVRPMPLSLDAIVCCTLVRDLAARRDAAKKKG